MEGCRQRRHFRFGGKAPEPDGVLGRSGMGVVYDAFDLALQAIKQLQRDQYTTSDDVERLLREARLFAQLKHPHLTEIFPVINQGDLFFVFRFVDGRPLDEVLSVNRKLPVSAVRKLIADVGSALDNAHAQNIIHRDFERACEALRAA